MRRRSSLSITITTITTTHTTTTPTLPNHKPWRPPLLPTRRFRNSVPPTTAKSPIPPVPAMSFFEADTPIDEGILTGVLGELGSARGFGGDYIGDGYVDVDVCWRVYEGVLAFKTEMRDRRRASLPAHLGALAVASSDKGPSNHHHRHEHNPQPMSALHPRETVTETHSATSRSQPQSTASPASTTASELSTAPPSPSKSSSPPSRRHMTKTQTITRTVPVPLLPLPSPPPLPALSPRFLFPRTPPLPPPTERPPQGVWTAASSDKKGNSIRGAEVNLSPVRVCFFCSSSRRGCNGEAW